MKFLGFSLVWRNLQFFFLFSSISSFLSLKFHYSLHYCPTVQHQLLQKQLSAKKRWKIQFTNFPWNQCLNKIEKFHHIFRELWSWFVSWNHQVGRMNPPPNNDENLNPSNSSFGHQFIIPNLSGFLNSDTNSTESPSLTALASAHLNQDIPFKLNLDQNSQKQISDPPKNNPIDLQALANLHLDNSPSSSSSNR